MLARLLAVLCLLVPNYPSDAQEVRAAEFSWRAQLGKRTADFLSAVGSFATCTSAGPAGFILQGGPPYHLSGAAETWSKQSSVIKYISCTAADKVRIKAYAHLEAIFQIVIEYPRCPGYATLARDDCDYNQRDYDLPIFNSLSDRPFYGAYGSSLVAANDRKAKRYFNTKTQLGTDEYSKGKVFNAEYCWGSGVSSFAGLDIQCIFEMHQSEGIFHSISVNELFEIGWFKNTIIAHLAARQEFALIDAEKPAIAAFEAEVTALLAEARQTETGRRQQEKDKRGPLQSVR